LENKILSIIIVNYNSLESIIPCIDSIFRNPPSCAYEIIIVDNNSKDNTLEVLEKSYGNRIILVRNDANLGFAKANNRAFLISKGKILAFLNSDTIIFENSLSELVNFLMGNSDVGIVGPKIINSDGSFQPQCKRGEVTLMSICGYLFKLYKVFPKVKGFGEYLLTYKNEKEISDISSVSGACLLVQRDIFERTGMFDERYFLHFEDLDLCYSVKKLGYRVVYYPFSKVMHVKGQSINYKTKYYFLDSFEKFYLKYLMKSYPSIINRLVLLIIKIYKEAIQL
jgi:GT2 family glycosyltransferase